VRNERVRFADPGRSRGHALRAAIEATARCLDPFARLLRAAFAETIEWIAVCHAAPRFLLLLGEVTREIAGLYGAED
jgi:hypothetical protein